MKLINLMLTERELSQIIGDMEGAIRNVKSELAAKPHDPSIIEVINEAMERSRKTIDYLKAKKTELANETNG